MTSTVTFNNNTVDASQIGGGYVSWQLVPAGPLVQPADSKPTGVSLAATTLNAYFSDGHFDIFQPTSTVIFNAAETVVLTGECRKHNNN